MRVLITPPTATGYPAYPLTVTGEITTSWLDGVGYEKAAIPCSMSDAEMEWIRGSVVHVLEPDWWGIAWEAPSADGVLQAIGWHAWGSLEPVDYSHGATAYYILVNHLDDLPTTALPAGLVTRWLAAPSGAITVSSDGRSTIAEIPAKCAREKDHHFGWYSERVGGIMLPQPHFYPRATSPTYVLDCSRIDQSGLSGDNMEPLANVVRVMYKDALGAQQYEDTAADTDATHYLVRAGIGKTLVVDMGDGDSAGALAVGAGILAVRSRDIASGTIRADELLGLTAGFVEAEGVRPGEIVRMMNVRGRSQLDAAITRKTIVGASMVIDVDTNAYTLKHALASLLQ